MILNYFLFVLFLNFSDTYLENVGSGNNGKLRLCVVNPRGRYKKAEKFCPILERETPVIECVIGSDSMDCLRRMNKGTADFGVFMPEELVATRWAGLNVLVTNQVPNRPGTFEEQIVAVVSKRLVPGGASQARPGGAAAVLHYSRLCHPWSDSDDDLSAVIQQYLESWVTERSCLENLTLAENRLRASSIYFKSSCKSSRWHPDSDLEQELQLKYPNLCEACASGRCNKMDRYWGPRGATYCLDDDAGDVLWARYTDIHSYFFRREDGMGGASASDWFYLCQDGSVHTITNSTEPSCVWLAKPWPVVVANSKAAVEVRYLCSQLDADALVSADWKGALAALLEARGTGEAVEILTPPLSPPVQPEDYLAQAKGFSEAYSQAGCQPPRNIRLCVRSTIEQNRCLWTSEAANVFGVEPSLECSKPETDEGDACFRAVSEGSADVAVGSPDDFVRAVRDFNLEPTVYESVHHVKDANIMYAYVNNASMTWSSLKGARAYFPGFDTLAWHAAFMTLVPECNGKSSALADFLGPSCVPGLDTNSKLPSSALKTLTALCQTEDLIGGEEVALRALVEGRTDVAFLSSLTVRKFVDGARYLPWASKLETSQIRPLCQNEKSDLGCHLTWTSLGHVYTNKNRTGVRRKEIEDLFKILDLNFGKSNTFTTPVFTLFGEFNNQRNVLFHDDTDILNTEKEMSSNCFNKLSRSFEVNIKDYVKYYQTCSGIYRLLPNSYVLVFFVIIFMSLQ